MKALFLLLSLASASALDFEAKTGLLYQDIPHLWSGFSREPSPAWNVEVNVRVAEFLKAQIKPHVGVTLAEQTSKVYLGSSAEWTCKSFFVSLGLGVAVHDGQLEWEAGSERKALGSRALFRIPVEAGFRKDKWSVSLLFEHVSNGYTANVNEGMDSLGLRFGWSF